MLQYDWTMDLRTGIFKLLKFEIAADSYQSAIEEEGCVSKFYSL